MQKQCWLTCTQPWYRSASRRSWRSASARRRRVSAKANATTAKSSWVYSSSRSLCTSSRSSATWTCARSSNEKYPRRTKMSVINGAGAALWSHSASAPVTGLRPPHNRRPGKLSYLLFYTKSWNLLPAHLVLASVIEKRISYYLVSHTIECLCVCVCVCVCVFCSRPIVWVHFL